MFDSIMVLENYWEKDILENTSNEISVKKFFEGFAELHKLKLYFRYFSDEKDIRHWINLYEKINTKPKLLYIAAHGAKGRIDGTHKSINLSTFIKLLKRKKYINYLMLGSCFVGNDSNLIKILKSNKNLLWVASYENSIPWIDSTVFDVLFLSRILDKPRRKKYNTIVRNIIQKEFVDFAGSMGFLFAFRKKGSNDIQILRPENPEEFIDYF